MTDQRIASLSLENTDLWKDVPITHLQDINAYFPSFYKYHPNIVTFDVTYPETDEILQKVLQFGINANDEVIIAQSNFPLSKIYSFDINTGETRLIPDYPRIYIDAPPGRRYNEYLADDGTLFVIGGIGTSHLTSYGGRYYTSSEDSVFELDLEKHTKTQIYKNEYSPIHIIPIATPLGVSIEIFDQNLPESISELHNYVLTPEGNYLLESVVKNPAKHQSEKIIFDRNGNLLICQTYHFENPQRAKLKNSFECKIYANVLEGEPELIRNYDFRNHILYEFPDIIGVTSDNRIVIFGLHRREIYVIE